MAYENIIYTAEDGIATITINRPKALNALNLATVLELKDCVAKIAKDTDNVKVVIITGAGAKSFVAGADITEMATMNPPQGRAWAQVGQGVFTDIENMPQPVIAAINGFALGGGCELSCACDIRYCAENAKFGQPEVGLGITPGFGGTQRLARTIGRGVAKEWIYTGSMYDAAEAYRVGLVNKVVPQEELMPAVTKLAKTIAKKAPVAVQMSKAAIVNGMNCDVHTGINYEAEVFGICFSTSDQKEGMGAFVEKRKPAFTGK
ncbi:MAG: enoyl-CoA hydratase-related protein [Megasphaera sp.]|jgi:enoyl-CoA hydratase|nr:enoyl-CoA hydratase-related protein [Megasphaera sp.]MCI1247811.1 enoyl-CoA hydratase-related protein [Megasphaera sp.]